MQRLSFWQDYRSFVSVGALAGAALLLESTLTRLLAVAQYYHFAFLVVSLAVLGFGASGSILTMMPRLLERNPEAGDEAIERLLAYSGVGFAVSVTLAYGVVNLLPFDSYSLAWDRKQIFLFMLYYLSLAIPFVCAGLGIGGALAIRQGRSHLVYAANLLGSGVGVLLAPFALWLAGVPGAVLFSIIAGLSATLSSGLKWGRAGRILLFIGLIAATGGIAVLSVVNLSGHAALGMAISPYKGLAYARQYPGAISLYGRWNAISRLDVMAGAGTRQLPGLSYTYPGIPPEQFGLSVDADSLQAISLVSPEGFAAGEFLPEALAFTLRPAARTLVLEPGGGLGVLQALAGGVQEVIAVINNRLVPEAISCTVPGYDIYHHAQVQTTTEATRAFLKRDAESYEVIFLPLTDAYRPVTSGAYSLSESYTLTVEGFVAMMTRLAPDGILVTSRWLQTPPSEEVRLIATLVEALEARNVLDLQGALVAYRGLQTITALVKPDGWNTTELTTIRGFLEERRYDLVWAPEIDVAETNRYNRLPDSVYYKTINDLFSAKNREEYYASFPYSITPPRDDRPFFFHFFTWKQTPELLAALGHTWQPFGGSGYFVLFALLILVTIFSGVLIIVPLLIRRRSRVARIDHHLQPQPKNRKRQVLRVLAYFSCLGLAFLFVEIPLIQRFILILGHPTYAFTLVVLALLSFSGLGSSLVRAAWFPRRTAMILLVALALLTPWAVMHLSDAVLGWETQWRALAAVISLAPLAILMGLPFPLGLAWLERDAPDLVAWAWAVNGCASVIASVLAAILALSYGFTLVLLLGAGAYSLAVLVLPGQGDKTNTAQVGGL